MHRENRGGEGGGGSSHIEVMGILVTLLRGASNDFGLAYI